MGYLFPRLLLPLLPSALVEGGLYCGFEPLPPHPLIAVSFVIRSLRGSPPCRRDVAVLRLLSSPVGWWYVVSGWLRLWLCPCVLHLCRCWLRVGVCLLGLCVREGFP